MSAVPHAATINAARESLLALHKSLIDNMRAEHERATGRPLTPGELLGLLTADAAFDWLHPFSQLIVAIDELLEREAPPTDRDAAAVRLEIARLIDGREPRYTAAADRATHVALEHGRLQAAVERLPDSALDEQPSLLELRSGWNGPKRRRTLKNKPSAD
ncbi:MAG: hypothetical protein ABI321_24560 [Polyangia bacterium]